MARAHQSAWDTLHERYRDHPALAAETVYALPPQLLDLLQRDLPCVLPSDDERFERDLTEAATVGFFRKRPIHYPRLNPYAAMSPNDSTHQITTKLNDMLEEYMAERGASPETISEYYESADRERTIVEEWRFSYAGWLATSSAFRRDRDRVRLQSKAVTGRLPAIEQSMTRSSSLPEDDNEAEEFLGVWLPFFHRWGIEELATWDLPVPMRAELSNTTLYDFHDVAEAGIAVFVPWYLTRHRGFDLYSVADQRGLVHSPPELGEWLFPKQKDWGPKRYLMMLRMYVYLELAVKARYAPRMRGKLTQLTEVFAEFFSHFSGESVSSDTIKKIRLEMNRRIAPNS
ncbi:MAG: hypothetical protein H0T51_01170 [Pirellulales bacterium]|nr:hypothetical protein [Pirellulales bacterium]